MNRVFESTVHVASVLVAVASLAVLTVGCQQPSKVSLDKESTKPGETASADAPDDTGLRRGYGPVDMRVEPCVRAEGDRVLLGQQCKTGLFTLGPNVNVPANADIELVYEVEATGKLSMWTDVTSAAGAIVHGSLVEQLVPAGQRRWFGHRIHFFQAASGVECRLFMRSEDPVDFKINDLAINVR